MGTAEQRTIIQQYGDCTPAVDGRAVTFGTARRGLGAHSKGPFIATQLNSTRRRVELSCVAINGPLRVKQADVALTAASGSVISA